MTQRQIPRYSRNDHIILFDVASFRCGAAAAETELRNVLIRHSE